MRLRKSYIGGFAISLAVFCGFGLIASLIAAMIPTSPVAEQFRFLHQNNYSSAAYASYAYQLTAQRIAVLDVWITLLSMAAAGLALGLRMGSKVRLRETVFYSVISAIILALLTLSVSWLETIFEERTLLATSGFSPASRMDSHYVLAAAGTTALWTTVYTVGAIIGHRLRRRRAPAAPTATRKSSKRRVASTTP